MIPLNALFSQAPGSRPGFAKHPDGRRMMRIRLNMTAAELHPYHGITREGERSLEVGGAATVTVAFDGDCPACMTEYNATRERLAPLELRNLEAAIRQLDGFTPAAAQAYTDEIESRRPFRKGDQVEHTGSPANLRGLKKLGIGTVTKVTPSRVVVLFKDSKRPRSLMFHNARTLTEAPAAPAAPLYHPLTGRPYPRDYFDAETVETLLLLVDSDIPAEIIEAWPSDKRAAAGNWALRVHLKASDNNRVRVPDKPAHVIASERPDPKGRLNRATGPLYGEGLRNDGTPMYSDRKTREGTR